MRIPKRSLSLFLLLNVLTLGIYGFVTLIRVGREINAICDGDGEQPRLSYPAAVMVRGTAVFVGILVGLVLGLAGSRSLDGLFSLGGAIGLSYREMAGFAGVKAAVLFLSMAAGGVGLGFLGSMFTGIYLNYWWYRQTGRLRNNAFRYSMVVKETGTDTYLFRTVFNLLLIPFTAILLFLAVLIPGLFVWLLIRAGNVGALVLASVLVFLISIPLSLFGMELTAGANFSFFFLFKNLNRYSDAVLNGAYPFDPMAYPYYPSTESMYPNYQPDLNNGAIASNGYLLQQLMGRMGTVEDKLEKITARPTSTTLDKSRGRVLGLSGSCAGYDFELNGPEEIVIGKDPKEAQIIIDSTQRQVSRKHVGISFDVLRDQYCVTDYSTNGTLADGVRLEPFRATYLRRGTILILADEKNSFRLV